jgi:hypothetical protein
MEACPQTPQGHCGGTKATGDVPKLAEVFREHAGAYVRMHAPGGDEARALVDILRCRTAVMGGYLEQCPECGHSEYRYHSCSNRNCPNCQWLRQVQWTQRQLGGFLPVAHHQVVTTLPGRLRRLARSNKKVIQGIMLRVSAETVAELVEERYGARVGQVGVLHTWNRELGYHMHVHLVVSCGGLSLDGAQWVRIPKDFLLPVAQLRTAFRRKLLQALVAAYRAKKVHLPGDLQVPGAFYGLIRQCWKEQWVVHIEAPVGTSSPVVKYLSQYVNRIGMSNSRLVGTAHGQVTFETRGTATLTLGGVEFLHRYLQHVVPKGFHKVRHYGLYSSTGRRRHLERARTLVPMEERVAHEPVAEGVAASEGWEGLVLALTGVDPRLCPKCGARITRTPVGRPRLGRGPCGPRGRDTS